MTEALKGNSKHKVLSSKQIQSTNDQMTKIYLVDLVSLVHLVYLVNEMNEKTK
jgi:hypothetical protein